MKQIALITLFSLSTISGFSQGNRIIDRNRIGWYTYNGDHKLARRWQLHTEYQWRRIDFIRTWQQSLARVGLVYKLTDRVNVSGGYTQFTTYPYGDYPSADKGVPVPEHRIYEDIELSDTFGRLGLSHRFRLEQRWLGQPSDAPPPESSDRTDSELGVSAPDSVSAIRYVSAQRPHPRRRRVLPERVR